jgi:hypothetical protein
MHLAERRIRPQYGFAELLRSKSEILFRHDAVSDAEGSFRKALKVAREAGSLALGAAGCPKTHNLTGRSEWSDRQSRSGHPVDRVR